MNEKKTTDDLLSDALNVEFEVKDKKVVFDRSYS